MTKRPVRAGFIVDRRDSLGVTLLMEAARQGERECLLRCLEEGSDINAVDNAGNNAVIHALQAGHDGIAIILMNQGAEVAKPTKMGITALMEACTARMPEVIDRLLQKKVPLDLQDRLGNTALMLSCDLGDGWAACRIAEEGADFEVLKNKAGFTALALARSKMKRDDLALFEKILEKRRDEKKLADIKAVEIKAQELEQNVHDATVLQRAIKPMKPVALKLKAR